MKGAEEQIAGAEGREGTWVSEAVHLGTWVDGSPERPDTDLSGWSGREEWHTAWIISSQTQWYTRWDNTHAQEGLNHKQNI